MHVPVPDLPHEERREVSVPASMSQLESRLPNITYVAEVPLHVRKARKCRAIISHAGAKSALCCLKTVIGDLSDFERGEIGPDLFRKACEFGLEGLVSKRSDRPYRGGWSHYWIKVKNR
jgi:ATP-dependent DNA ligase